MKSTIAASFFAMSMLVLGGCSSMQDKTTMATSTGVTDAAYVARVEQTARERGVWVRWINPPQKRRAADQF